MSDALVGLFALPAALLLASAGLLAFAWRGRRINDHPICRRCGFDLIGRPIGSAVCSECGADLVRPRAARRGRRRVRRRLLAVAAAGLAVCVAWLGVLGWGVARGSDWTRHKPAWWLLRDARGPGTAARDAALVELTSRFRGGRLTAADADALVELALDIQGDRWRPWTDAVADVLAAARDLKRMPDERWERYVRQAAPPQLRVGPEVRRGDPLDPQVSLFSPRLAQGDAQDSDVHLVRLIIGEASVDLSRGPRRVAPVEAALARLPDGTHTARAVVRRVVRHTTPQKRKASLDEQVELTAPVTLIPRVSARVRLSTRPARETVEESLTVTRLGVEPSPGRRGGRGGGAQVTLHVRAVDPPVGMAFRAALRAGAREWEVGGLSFPPGRRSLCVATADLADLPGFDATSVDVVLRPSPEEAIRAAYLAEIWGGEVVIKAVPVDPPPPTGAG